MEREGAAGGIGPRHSGTHLLLLAVVIGVAVFLFWQLSHLFLLLFGAILVAIVFRQAAALLEWVTPLRGRWSVLLAILLIGVLIGAAVFLLGSQVRTQAVELIAQAPELVERIEEWTGIDNLEERLVERAREASEGFSMVSGVFGFSTSFALVVAEIVLVVVSGVFLALRPDLYRSGLLKIVPPRQRKDAAETMEALQDALPLWLFGQLASMVLVGVLTTAGLLALGVPSALALGLIAAALEFVPFIGPVAAAIPAIAVGASEGLSQGLWVLGLYLLIQQIEGNLITPLVQQRAVDLPPVLTMFSIIAFGTLFGLLGVLLATPLTVVLFVVVKKLWVRDTLHEETELPGESD